MVSWNCYSSTLSEFLFEISFAYFLQTFMICITEEEMFLLLLFYILCTSWTVYLKKYANTQNILVILQRLQ